MEYKLIWDSALFFIMIFLLAGCFEQIDTSFTASESLEDMKDKERRRWFEGGTGAPNLKPSRNFYMMDLDRYPDVGIVIHSVDFEDWNTDCEKSSIVQAVTVCRAEFSLSYAEKSIIGWDGMKTHQAKWLPPGGVPAVHFHPKQVVILIRNANAKEYPHLKKSADVPAKDIPEEDLLKPFKIGYLFDSEDLFTSKESPAEIARKGFRDEHPLRFEIPEGGFYHDYVYVILDHYKVDVGQGPP